MHSRLVFIFFTGLLAACGTVPPPSKDDGGTGDTDAGTPSACVIREDQRFRQASELRALEGCREVTGNLFIQSAPDVTDLSPLALLEEVSGHLELKQTGVGNLDDLGSLRRIGGDLRIEGNSQLTRVDGLSALESVGKNVSLSSNAALTAIEGWSALTSVGEGFEVSSHDRLARVTGFARLQQVGRSLNFSSNPRLEVLADMPALTTVGTFELSKAGMLERLTGFARVTTLDVLSVSSNPKLSEVDAFAGVTTLSTLYVMHNERLAVLSGLNELRVLEDSATLSSNPMLSRLEALRSLRSVKVQLTLGDLPALKSLEALRDFQEAGWNLSLLGLGVTDFKDLSSLTRVGRRLEIQGNLQLTSLRGLGALSSVGAGTSSPHWGVYVSGNPALRSLDGLNSLKTASLWVEKNENLERLTRMDRVTALSQHLFITSNPRLLSLEGLEQLVSVETFTLRDNESLSGLNALRALKSVGNVLLMGNLTSLEGLAGLDEVTGYLSLADLPRLKTLHGLERLTAVGGSLQVSADAISSLSGLDSLTRVGGVLMISRCDALERLTGLGALRSVGSNYQVHDNTRLPSCEAENLLQRLRANGHTGEVRISGNGGTGTCP